MTLLGGAWDSRSCPAPEPAANVLQPSTHGSAIRRRNVMQQQVIENCTLKYLIIGNRRGEGVNEPRELHTFISRMRSHERVDNIIGGPCFNRPILVKVAGKELEELWVALLVHGVGCPVEDVPASGAGALFPEGPVALRFHQWRPKRLAALAYHRKMAHRAPDGRALHRPPRCRGPLPGRPGRPKRLLPLRPDEGGRGTDSRFCGKPRRECCLRLTNMAGQQVSASRFMRREPAACHKATELRLRRHLANRPHEDKSRKGKNFAAVDGLYRVGCPGTGAPA